ncbi:glycosyltransferase [Cytobacillus horneckiae]|nr:glycosyltransferase family 4 protein [Cytobacillus horneckiae]
MEQLLANPDKAVKMGINAHEKVMEKYTKERTQSKWVELFDELEMNESNRQ